MTGVNGTGRFSSIFPSTLARRTDGALHMLDDVLEANDDGSHGWSHRESIDNFRI